MQRTSVSQTIDQVEKNVTLYGWVNSYRDHGKLVFFDLRDYTGLLQIVVNPQVSQKAFEEAGKLSPEDVVKVSGLVKSRVEKYINADLPTGKVEVEATEISLINKSTQTPFEIDADGRDVDELLRLKYRYLDLRRPRLNSNIRLRHQIIRHMRGFLDDRGFVEIETPILTKATPEGARDFLVPSRLQPGKFYALPQSPQQYKQLLMVAGFEKYYQIARCFRDEDPRADRCYGEFTQLDMEMSFVDQEELLNLTEALMIEITEKVVGKKVYKKPFPRFTYQEAMEKYGNDKFDIREEKDPDVLGFAWVLDFPLFEKTQTRALAPSHHPFTAPKNEDLGLLESDPLKVRSLQHDLVCNGYEVGGGSIRITDPKLQKKIFEILGHTSEEVQEKFGHLLKAFEYGVPPHGGIAPGIERLMMIFANEENTREVMAFPAISSGQVSVMDAPSKVDAGQLKELHLKTDL